MKKNMECVICSVCNITLSTSPATLLLREHFAKNSNREKNFLKKVLFRT